MTLQNFEGKKILVIGDLMLDRYIYGEVNRISPEAPVPIILIKEKTTTLGGAGNVVRNLISLGAEVSVCGLIGYDTDGENVYQLLKDLKVDVSGIIWDHRKTTKKTRIIGNHQHMIRLDNEADPDQQITQSAFINLIKNIRSKPKDVDGVIISDYNKGMISRGIVEMIRHDINNIPIVVDPKSEDYTKYREATIITPNLNELNLLLERFCHKRIKNINDISDIKDDLYNIMIISEIKYILVTCGPEGMSLFGLNSTENDIELITQIKSKAKEVYDVSGAGDTVVATLTLALASKFSIEESSEIANYAAGIVVGKLGTATVELKELENHLISEGLFEKWKKKIFQKK